MHTWTQRLQQHFHLHCIVPGGVWRALADETGHNVTGEWISCRGKWLFRKDSLADAFRNRYLRRLCSLRQRGKLLYTRRAAPLADATVWESLLAMLENQTWIVFPKPTPTDPTQTFDYVARYTHKVAISDSRIKTIENGRVTYSWRDRSNDNTEKTETIPVELFTRRFLAHVLPNGFHKIRYFGWMTAAYRKTVLAAILQSLHTEPPVTAPTKESLTERLLRQTGIDITLCPNCGKGHLRKSNRHIMPYRGQSP